MTTLLRYGFVLLYLLLGSLPLAWMGITALKPKQFSDATHITVLPAIGSSATGDLDLRPPPEVSANATAALAAYAADPLPLLTDDDMSLARTLAAGQAPSVSDLHRAQTWLTGHRQWPQRADYARQETSFQEWMGRGGTEGLAWLGKLLPAVVAAEDRWRASVFFPPTTAGFTGLSRPTTVGGRVTFFDHLFASVLIGAGSTLAAVALGTATAYGFSRYLVRGSRDWLFFILSTRFLPPLAVVVPILLMWRSLGLENTHGGLIVLYTAFNLSLAVWLMKGFLDEIPRAYEEAALVDGYSRAQAFWRVVLPQAHTGMAVTAVFCLIAAWNEYGFAVTLNQLDATTVPVFFAGQKGDIGGTPWPQLAAGAVLFALPIAVFVVLVRRHLLRGVTFGTVKG